MDSGLTYSVIVTHGNGKRDLRARQVTLETARVKVTDLGPLPANSWAVIELAPPRGMSRGWLQFIGSAVLGVTGAAIGFCVILQLVRAMLGSANDVGIEGEKLFFALCLLGAAIGAILGIAVGYFVGTLIDEFRLR